MPKRSTFLMLKQCDDMINNIEAVKGKEYSKLVLLNLKMGLLISFLNSLEIDGDDKQMIFAMLQSFGEGAMRMWEGTQSAERLEDINKTLRIDVDAVWKVMQKEMSDEMQRKR